MEYVELLEEGKDQVVLQDEEVGSDEEADRYDLRVAPALDFRISAFSKRQGEHESYSQEERGGDREQLSALAE